MRTVYHEKLAELSEQLGQICAMAGAAMERATQALLQADFAAAEQVMSNQDQIAARCTRAEESAIALLALQQPVAGELRSILQLDSDRRRRGPHGCAGRARPPVSEGVIHTTCCPRKSTAALLKWAG